MARVEYSEILPGTPEPLFDLTQDYAQRPAWDPFPKGYDFLPPANGPGKGAALVVHARNGRSMTVRYVSYNRPRAAAIEMIDGPWFIARFAGTWLFEAVGDTHTRVSFKYHVLAGPRWLAWLIQPLLLRSFRRHARQRVQALHRHVLRRECAATRDTCAAADAPDSSR